MPRFFYSAPNLNNYYPPEPWWRRWHKKKERKKSLQKLDPHLVQVKNPFRKEKREMGPYRYKIAIISLIILFFSWIGAMIFLPYFRINKLNLSGLNIIKPNEIESFVRDNFINTNKWWPSNNYFILSTKKIANAIKNNFSVESVIINKSFPDSLSIQITEKSSSIVYDNGKNYILLDDKGNFIKILRPVADNEFVSINISEGETGSSTKKIDISTSTTTTIINPILVHKPNFSEIKKEVNNALPLLVDNRMGRENKNQLEEEVVSAVLTWQKLLQGGEVGEIQYFILNNIAAGLTIKTTAAFDILVNIHGNHESTMNNLRATLRDTKPKEYIDLRYGDKIYLK